MAHIESNPISMTKISISKSGTDSTGSRLTYYETSISMPYIAKFRKYALKSPNFAFFRYKLFQIGISPQPYLSRIAKSPTFFWFKSQNMFDFNIYRCGSIITCQVQKHESDIIEVEVWLHFMTCSKRDRAKPKTLMYTHIKNSLPVQ